MKQYEKMEITINVMMQQDVITTSELYASFEYRSVENTNVDTFSGKTKFIKNK